MRPADLQSQQAEPGSLLRQLVDERAALRRVAALVARDASQTELCSAISEEIGRLLDFEEVGICSYEHGPSAIVAGRWGERPALHPIGARLPLQPGGALARVFETERPTRFGAPDNLLGLRQVVAAPILVKGRLWGAIVAGTQRAQASEPGAEARLADIVGLMETAITDAESQARGERLVEAQAALRRVATLVAKESTPEEIFANLAEEVGHVLGGVDCVLFRNEADGTATTVAVAGSIAATLGVGTRVPVDGDGVVASVLRTGRPHRIDDTSSATGTLSEIARAHHVRSAAGCPVLVGGRVWGVLSVGATDKPLQRGSQARLTQFGDLVATAIVNAEARGQVTRLASEQTALRRVATLVAEGAEPAEVFEAVAAEMAALLDADGVIVSRYEADRAVTVVAHSGFDAWNGATTIATEGAAHDEAIAQIVQSLGARAAVRAPIVVDGRHWGGVIAGWTNDEPPAGSEARMSRFAELLETAIANADSRDQLTASRVRLLTASDDARRRVVRDLHDGAQQRLVHTIITIKFLQQSLRANDGRAEALAGEALEHAESGHRELRELAHGILPTVLTHGGLRAGVRALVERLDMRVGVDLPAERFATEIEASAYFIVAEALTNVVKHAAATRADVTARVEGMLLLVEVRDDGVGGADNGGHGLVGIGDRVTALGGCLEIDSPAGGGTRIVATLPLATGAA
jgi:signal transduction histidine kinase